MDYNKSNDTSGGNKDLWKIVNWLVSKQVVLTNVEGKVLLVREQIAIIEKRGLDNVYWFSLFLVILLLVHTIVLLVLYQTR